MSTIWLAPHGNWCFKALVMEDNTVKAKVVDEHPGDCIRAKVIGQD